MPESAPLPLALHAFVGLCAVQGDLDSDSIALAVSTSDDLEPGAVEGWAEHGERGGQIEIVNHPKAHPIRVQVVLLHEVVHFSLPRTSTTARCSVRPSPGPPRKPGASTWATSLTRMDPAKATPGSSK